MGGKRSKPGDVFKIKLGDGFHSYALRLNEPLFAFYDLRTTEDLALSEITGAGILFEIWVMRYAVSKGLWTKEGFKPLNEQEREPRTFFKQDMLNGKLTSYKSVDANVQSETPISFEEASKLERAAVWGPKHIEDRLRDHFNGTPNKWVESLRPKRTTGL